MDVGRSRVHPRPFHLDWVAVGHVPLVGWFALLLAPLARTTLVTTARVVAVVLAVGYAIGIAAALASGGGAMPDIATLSGSRMPSRRRA